MPVLTQGIIVDTVFGTETVGSTSLHDLAELEVRVQERLSGRVRDLHLLLYDDGIVLRGFAHTYYAKQIAQHAVMTETALPIRANEIDVR